MEKAQHFAVILAGGGGTRLWPVSRQKTPKQIQPFLDDQTLLQKTYKRLRKFYSPTHILISTNRAQLSIIRQQLPRLPLWHYILEPQKKDTAGAVGLIAAVLASRNPDHSFVTINSDHHIVEAQPYYQALKSIQQAVAQYPAQTVLAGVKPTYPETGYGYIEVDSRRDGKFYQLKRFVEKPSLAIAKRYVADKKYLWNPALFSWRSQTLLDLLAQHLPAAYGPLEKIKQSPTVDNIAKQFSKLPSISIDYGLLEKLKTAIVVKADYQFTDIGHWETLRSSLADHQDKNQNIIKGLAVVDDSHGNLIYNFSDRLVATTGLQNMIVVQTADATFISPRHKAQNVKQLVKILKQQGLEKYL